jgi:hypothetical protein
MTRTQFSLSLAAIALFGASCSSVWNTGTKVPAFEHGMYRLGGAAGLSFSDSEFNGVDTDTLAASADLGRFYGTNLELGVRLGLVSTDVGAVETDTTNLALFGRWYTASEAASRPWIELGGGVSNVETGTLDVSGSLFFLGIGLTQFLNESVAAEISVRQSIGSFDGGIESDTLDLGLGFSLFW